MCKFISFIKKKKRTKIILVLINDTQRAFKDEVYPFLQKKYNVELVDMNLYSSCYFIMTTETPLQVSNTLTNKFKTKSIDDLIFVCESKDAPSYPKSVAQWMQKFNYD